MAIRSRKTGEVVWPPPAGEIDRRGGIECPKCGCRHFNVEKTEHVVTGRIDRRRICRHCGALVRTAERVLTE